MYLKAFFVIGHSLLCEYYEVFNLFFGYLESRKHCTIVINGLEEKRKFPLAKWKKENYILYYQKYIIHT